MTVVRRTQARRSAFTLIELLVVIAIIAILVSLTSAAVMQAYVVGFRAAVAADIQGMQSKIGSAKADLNNTVILPSHLRLREDGNYNPLPDDGFNADRHATLLVLQSAFGTSIGKNYTTQQIDWNGNGTIESGDLVLEGEQCLVFWLGGTPTIQGGNIGMTGFSTNPANPAQAGANRRRPYFEFQSGRLMMYTAPGSSISFPVYQDTWKTGKPYAYFSSYALEGAGDYHADCPSLGVSPYWDPAGKWVNAGSFQIISAGRDGKFGAGGNTWNPTSGTSDPNGRDDQANFSPRQLGAPAN
jgi:prepilin-type N-terminal cleavage/methylation domain-containing protein